MRLFEPRVTALELKVYNRSEPRTTAAPPRSPLRRGTLRGHALQCGHCVARLHETHVLQYPPLHCSTLPCIAPARSSTADGPTNIMGGPSTVDERAEGYLDDNSLWSLRRTSVLITACWELEGSLAGIVWRHQVALGVGLHG